MGGTTALFSNTARTNTNEGENQKYYLQSSQVKHTRQDSINVPKSPAFYFHYKYWILSKK